MSYFPKHYIKPNQYTAGGEFMYLSTQLEYKGWYWSTGNGRYYTGQTPQSPQNLEIVKMIPVGENLDFNNQPLYTDKIKIALEGDAPVVGDGNLAYNSQEVIKYSYLKNVPLQPSATKLLPQYNPVIPNSQNYQNGEFRRYFAKKTNISQYIEINQQTFAQIQQKNPAIEWTLYFPFFVDWKLTGDKQQVYNINRNMVLYQMKKFNLYNFDQYLGFDFTKYYNQLGTSTSGSYINGVNQGYVLDNRDGRSTGVFDSQNDSGSIRRDNSISR